MLKSFLIFVIFITLKNTGMLLDFKKCLNSFEFIIFLKESTDVLIGNFTETKLEYQDLFKTSESTEGKNPYFNSLVNFKRFYG